MCIYKRQEPYTMQRGEDDACNIHSGTPFNLSCEFFDKVEQSTRFHCYGLSYQRLMTYFEDDHWLVTYAYLTAMNDNFHVTDKLNRILKSFLYETCALTRDGSCVDK